MTHRQEGYRVRTFSSTCILVVLVLFFTKQRSQVTIFLIFILTPVVILTEVYLYSSRVHHTVHVSGHYGVGVEACNCHSFISVTVCYF